MNDSILNDDDEVVVPLASGWSLRSGVYNGNAPDALTSGEYVRLVRPDGTEAIYWDQEEWRTDPALVMGAIVNSAAGLMLDDEIAAPLHPHVTITWAEVDGCEPANAFRSLVDWMVEIRQGDNVSKVLVVGVVDHHEDEDGLHILGENADQSVTAFAVSTIDSIHIT